MERTRREWRREKTLRVVVMPPVTGRPATAEQELHRVCRRRHGERRGRPRTRDVNCSARLDPPPPVPRHKEVDR